MICFMPNYKFEILSELVKHDDYMLEKDLFGENLEKYANILSKLDWHENLVDRMFLAGDWKIRLTDKGRKYYFDELLPQRQQMLVTNTPNIKEKKHPNRYINWVLDNKDIIGIILTIIGIIVGVLALK